MTNVTGDILSMAEQTTLLDSTGDYDTYLCESTDHKFCVAMITYEYEVPELNYKTEWFNTEEQAKQVYANDFAEV